MKIKRRVLKGEKYKEITENVKLVKKKKLSVSVQLKNGDIIKRKNKDVIEWDK